MTATNTSGGAAEDDWVAQRSEAVSALLYAQQTWQLRKVQSHELREGSYSVARVSIDCVPQDLPGLRYALVGEPDDTQDPLIVPVTYMQKGALRQFDMRGPNAEPLPVIGRSEYTDLMLGVLMYQMEDAVIAGSDRVALLEALRVILDEDPGAATRASRLLLERGVVADGAHVVEPDLLRGFAVELLQGLTTAYVLFALLPSEYVQRRAVIKYAHHGHQGVERLPWTKRWLGAVGLAKLQCGLSSATLPAPRPTTSRSPCRLLCPAPP